MRGCELLTDSKAARSKRPSLLLPLRLLVARRIDETRRREADAAQPAGIAAATGAPLRVRLVAGDGLSVVDAEPRALADDLGLRPANERRVDAAGTALHSGAGSKRREAAERGDEFRPAVRIAAGIEDV